MSTSSEKGGLIPALPNCPGKGTWNLPGIRTPVLWKDRTLETRTPDPGEEKRDLPGTRTLHLWKDGKLETRTPDLGREEEPTRNVASRPLEAKDTGN